MLSCSNFVETDAGIHTKAKTIAKTALGSIIPGSELAWIIWLVKDKAKQPSPIVAAPSDGPNSDTVGMTTSVIMTDGL